MRNQIRYVSIEGYTINVGRGSDEAKYAEIDKDAVCLERFFRREPFAAAVGPGPIPEQIVEASIPAAQVMSDPIEPLIRTPAAAIPPTPSLSDDAKLCLTTCHSRMRFNAAIFTAPTEVIACCGEVIRGGLTAPSDLRYHPVEPSAFFINIGLHFLTTACSIACIDLCCLPASAGLFAVYDRRQHRAAMVRDSASQEGRLSQTGFFIEEKNAENRSLASLASEDESRRLNLSLASPASEDESQRLISRK